MSGLKKLWIYGYWIICTFTDLIRKNMEKKIHAKNLTRIWIIGYSCRIISGLKKSFFQSKLALVRIKNFHRISSRFKNFQIYVSRKDLKFEDFSVSIHCLSKDVLFRGCLFSNLRIFF